MSERALRSALLQVADATLLVMDDACAALARRIVDGAPDATPEDLHWLASAAWYIGAARDNLTTAHLRTERERDA